MRILHLSDTHNLHRQLSALPAADVIVHSGDVSYAGTGPEVMDFIEWFGALDYKYKIFLAGNHDSCLDGKSATLIQALLPEGCYYLCNTGIDIEGVKFWGVPFFFSEELSGDYIDGIARIPVDTDVLVSHRSPQGILDISDGYTYGCPDLRQKVLDLRPRYHLFGHIHDAYGVEKSAHTTFANAALVDEDYQLVNAPLVFDV